MKRLITSRCIGLLALLASTAGTAATVNVVPSSTDPSFSITAACCTAEIGVGVAFSVTIQGVDFPANVGPSLGLSFDDAVVTYVSTELPASGPFSSGSGAFLTLFPSSGTPTDIFVTPAGSPAGDFDAFVINFLTIAPGAASIMIIDDGDVRAWFDDVNFEPIPTDPYNQANVTVIGEPVPVEVTTFITGSLSSTEEHCPQDLTNLTGDGENCLYNGGPAAGGYDPTGLEVTGPYGHVAYYDSVASPAAVATIPDGDGFTLYAPVPGDGKIAPVIVGNITINDNANGFGDDDLVSLGITISSPGTGDVVKSFGPLMFEQFSSITHTLDPVGVDAATPNEFGGFDYVIGSTGFPALLTYAEEGPCVDVPFGSVECAHTFGAGTTEPDYWNGTSTPGLGSLESNIGAKTSGVLANLQCMDAVASDGTPSGACRSSPVAISPWIYGCTGLAGCDLGVERGAAEDAGWDQLLIRISTDATGKVQAVAGFNVEEYVAATDDRCGDNVTGTNNYSATCPAWTSGYFTAGAGAAEAVDDTAVTTRNVAISIPIGTNDETFTSSTVTATSDGCDAGGVLAIVGSGGSTSGISADYTPTSAPNSVGYTEVCGYTLNDGLHPASSALVTVTVNNTPVVAGDAPMTISTAGSAPGSTPGTVNAAAVAGNSLGNAPSVVTKTDGTKGTVAVSGTTLTYTPGATFFSGTDTFTYTITDADPGTPDSDTGTVTVSIADVSPTIADGAITTDEDTASAAFSPTITAGNGTGAQHTLTTSAGTDGTCALSAADATGTLTYTPDADFSGTDTCVLTLTDGDGSSDTATITVTVEAARRSSGSSSTDLWSLALLASLPLVRRRRR